MGVHADGGHPVNDNVSDSGCATVQIFEAVDGHAEICYRDQGRAAMRPQLPPCASVGPSRGASIAAGRDGAGHRPAATQSALRPVADHSRRKKTHVVARAPAWHERRRANAGSQREAPVDISNN
jgi:hypothetical protein